MQVSSNKSSGFTVVELIIVMVVGGIMMGTIIFGLGSYYEDSVTSAQRTTQDTDTRSVLRTIENELVNSAGFITDLNVSSSPLGSNNLAAPWTYKGNNAARPEDRVLIGQVYATDKASSDPTRMLVFTNPTSGCGDPTTGTPVKNALIYFIAKDPVKDTYNLYRRTLVNTVGGTPCTAPFQKQTCASGNIATYPAVCAGNDALLLSDINSFAVDYYASSNDANPIANQYTTALTTDIAAAKSVRLTVTTNRLVNGKKTLNSADIRISRPY